MGKLFSLYHFTPSVKRATQPSIPIISRTQNCSECSGPIEFDVNLTVRIWCRAENDNANGSRKLQALFWRDNNSSRVYSRGNLNNSYPDVYSERIDGKVGNYTRTWIRALHFIGTQPFYTGDYECIANYNGEFKNATVTVIISSGCTCAMHCYVS